MSAPGPTGPPVTVWFLSDYGYRDEFVGVCHAAMRWVAPHVAVVDLTHEIAPFDVEAGAEALLRAVGHLGPGAVLAVVDPGVGSDRLGVAVEVEAAAGPRWFVGPDNGLLLAAAEWSGALAGAWVLHRPPGVAATFDGRDVFAPAAALLCAGVGPGRLGDPVDPADLVRLAPPVCDCGPGRVRASVTWVDRYGNVQLAAPAAAGPGVGPAEGAGPTVQVAVQDGARWTARRVRAFSDLGPDELGVVADANGRLALVCWRRSAAAMTGTAAGRILTLTW